MHRQTIGSLVGLLGELPADRSERAVEKIRIELSVGHVVHFDGAIRTWRDQTKVAAFGWVHLKDGKEMNSGGGVIQHNTAATSNVAEYGGLCAALVYAFRACLSPVTIVGDSRLVIDQVEDRCKTNAQHLLTLRNRARRTIDYMTNAGVDVTLRWVVRQANGLADSRADQAYNDYLLEMIK